MTKHVINYYKAFGYHKGDFIACELCGGEGCEIHHVEPRSKFGTKRKVEQDSPSNLVALCRKCHEKAHGPMSKMYKEVLKNIIKKRP